MEMKKFYPMILCLIPISWIIIDLTLNGTFVDANVKFTNSIQQDDGSGTDTFFKIVSYLFASQVVPVILVLFFCIPRHKIPGIKLAMYTVFSVYFIECLKMIYAQPRPFHVDNGVHAKSCEQDFGRPSGHACGGIVLYFSIYWLFIHNAKVSTENLAKFKIFKIFAFVFLVALIFLIGFSRVYLGVHSFGQVLLGWVYGILYMIILVNYVNEPFEKYLKSLYKHPKKLKAFCILTSVFLSFLLIAIIIYLAARDYSTYPALEAAIAKKCDEDIDYGDIFYEAHLTTTSMVSGGFGLIYAILLVNDTKKDYPKRIHWFKQILRVLLYIIIAGIIMVIFEIIPENETVVWINFFLLDLPPFLLITILLSWLLPILFTKLNLSRENDFLEVEFRDTKLPVRRDSGENEKLTN